jgi:hypothetical protein
METLLFLVGCMLLVYGIVKVDEMSIFFAIIIIPGVFILKKVRKRDWKKHWEDMEAEQKARAAWKMKQSSPQEGPKKGD